MILLLFDLDKSVLIELLDNFIFVKVLTDINKELSKVDSEIFTEKNYINFLKKDFAHLKIKSLPFLEDIEKYFQLTIYLFNTKTLFLKKGTVSQIDLTSTNAIYRGLAYVGYFSKKVSWSKFDYCKLRDSQLLL